MKQITWIPATSKTPTGQALLIFPGGGYGVRVDEREGTVIGNFFAARGIACGVVHYRHSGEGAFYHPIPLEDAKAAIREVRANARTLGIDPQKIGVIGFSAGGHLAGLVSTCTREEWNEKEVSSRPDFSILLYPVATMCGDWRHEGSCENLLGPENKDDVEKRKALSLERRVTPDTPPMFLAHTAQDGLVPPKNSIMLADALLKEKIPVAFHLFPYGNHGLDLGFMQPLYDSWTQLVLSWLQQL